MRQVSSVNVNSNKHVVAVTKGRVKKHTYMRARAHTYHTLKKLIVTGGDTNSETWRGAEKTVV